MGYVGLDQWFGHHVNSGQEYVVFATAGHPAMNPENLREYDIEIDIPVPPVIIQVRVFVLLHLLSRIENCCKLRGTINLEALTCDIKVYAKVPFLPAIFLGGFGGDLKSGIELTVGVPLVISGTLKLYVAPYGSHKWLMLDASATVFGKKFVITGLRLIPLPK
jgi:hypothetical protein